MIERANPLWVSLTPSVSFDNRAMCCFGATKNHRNDALWLGNYRRAGKKTDSLLSFVAVFVER
jgi:hypothetical protein